MKIIAHIFLHDFRGNTSELACKCVSLGPRVETPSQNEAFIDLSGKKPPGISLISAFTGTVIPSLGSFATISLASCKLLAKALTTAYTANPSGSGLTGGIQVKVYNNFRLCVIKPETAGDFTSRLPVEFMWPLEDKIIRCLKTLGLKSFGEISGVPLTMLYSQFGSLAPVIMNYSKGIDTSNVPYFSPPDKITYHSHCECSNITGLEEILKQAAIYLSQTLQKQGKSYRELSLAIFSELYFTEIVTSSFTRGKYDIRSIYHDCMNLLKKLRTSGRVTGISLAAGHLTNCMHSQMSLFEDPKTLNGRYAEHHEKLCKVCENLASRYSPGIVKMGSSLPVSRREQMLMFVDPLRNNSKIGTCGKTAKDDQNG
ncbi:hypothetical protein [Phosphitispora sp. TUW77]|uniref:DinB/UmuC family translesion DNA polymerase n=1 Tax=Phosphitispora sp. TUW77 TaxID=3152361 RepID=UPI003AB19EF7